MKLFKTIIAIILVLMVVPPAMLMSVFILTMRLGKFYADKIENFLRQFVPNE